MAAVNASVMAMNRASLLQRRPAERSTTSRQLRVKCMAGPESRRLPSTPPETASGGVPLFIGSAVLFTLASVIPMFKGVSKESKSQEIMSSGAEMLNGRFAMIGLVALALTEYLKGGPLIS